MTAPKGTLKISIDIIFFNVPEWKRFAECAKIIVGRIALEFFPKFKLKAVIPDHTVHEYSQQMSEKSIIVSLPIINANEAKYDDCGNSFKNL